MLTIRDNVNTLLLSELSCYSELEIDHKLFFGNEYQLYVYYNSARICITNFIALRVKFCLRNLVEPLG